MSKTALCITIWQLLQVDWALIQLMMKSFAYDAEDIAL
jgi:hypothetical protein